MAFGLSALADEEVGDEVQSGSRVKESGFSMRRAQVSKSKTGQSSDLCPSCGSVLGCVQTKFALGRSIKPRPVKLTIHLE